MENGSYSSEPSNHLHRPTSAKTQDISHILSKQFGEQFIRESIDPQVVQNLRVSHAGGSDPHHEEFVAKLLGVVDERQRRLDRLGQLERSIMAAKARAMSADEKLANRQQVGQNGYPDLGLPAPSSHFRSCLDAELLRGNGLIGPNDLVSRLPPPVPPPSAKSSRQQQLRAKTASSAASAKRSRQSENESTHWSVTSPVDLLEEESRMSEGSFKVKSAPRVRSARQQKLDKLDARRNVNWQEECSVDGRNEGRRLLENFESRVKFLPNPKFLLPMDQAGSGNLVTDRLARDPGDARIFVANPQKLVFSDYVIGQVYQLTLELRNVSCSLRYIRVLPPRTKYFSLSLGQFPGEGEVAPGLCCKYSVTFAPDSLRDFEDEIVVETQAGNSLAVPVIAQRPRPVLTVPSELHVGECLLHGAKAAFVRLQNKGGDGKFVILRADQWPETNLKRAVQGDSTSDGTFELRPSNFELARGESVTLEVTFFARGAETFRSSFVFVCDNCQVKELQVIGVGQAPCVSLASLEGGGQPEAGESSDATSAALVRFEEAHPYTYCQRALALRNEANVDVCFAWKVVKPHCLPPDADFCEPPSQRTLDPDSPFSVEPEDGVLPAGAVVDFAATFAPRSVGQYHSALHLLLLDVPVAPAEVPGRPGPNGVLPALELQCKAACQPLLLRLQPPAVAIPGDILVGTTVREKVEMINDSRAAVTFSWQALAGDTIVEMEPAVGVLEAGQSAMASLCVTATQPGGLDCTLLCKVEHLDDPVPLRLTANVRGLRVAVEQPDVNFGLLRVGEVAELEVAVRNPYQLACSWSCDLPTDSELQLLPASGQLAPLELRRLRLRFAPTSEQQLQRIFRIDAEGGESAFVSAFADVQSPAVCLLDSHALADIQDLFLDVESSYTVQLYNQTMLGCAFAWQPPTGPGAAVCHVRAEPQAGCLAPREAMDVTVFVRPRQIGQLDKLLLACAVDGQQEPVVLKVGGEMKGISVSCHCTEEATNFSDAAADAAADAAVFPDAEASVQLLDFGCVPIHGVAKRFLHIRNDTSITANFSLDVDFFKAVPPETEIVLPMQRSEISARRGQRQSLLSKTPNLADPKSKPYHHAFYDMCKLYLRQNKGAAFHCEPSSGVLQPYSVTSVQVTAYTDMWGDYTDSLRLCVDCLAPVELPLRLQVNGCPVQFTMTAGRQLQEPMLRFGSATHGSGSVTRPVRLNNKSPFAVRLDWRVFNVCDGDEQLLDFLVDFGRQFPPLGEDGEELLPTIPGDTPPPSERPPTGHLPDSPSSSRAVTAAASDRSDDAEATTRGEEATGAGAEGEAAEQQLKVVVVNVRPHEGHPAAAPFTVRPAQLTIPPESYDYVQVTFDSSSIDQVTEALDFKSYMLAYMSLDEERAQVPDKVHRGLGHSADQLRLDMTGRVERPELDVDYTNDDGFTYYAAASDLLADDDSDELAASTTKTSFATLRNLRDTPLSFRLSTDAPFVVRQPRVADVQLVPRQTCLVELGFLVTSSALSMADADGDSELPDGVELLTNETSGERTLRFSGQLVMQFANGSQQALPLLASLKFPSLSVAKEALDYGVCMVGQRREMTFTLSNLTASASRWRAELTELSDTCQPGSTFELQPVAGKLDGSVTYLSKNKATIRVFFLPKHAEHYSAAIVFTGCLGERPRIVRLSGVGSYDEQHRSLYNE